ncbi:hypothetical protein FRC01_014479, partial [Tulasnella sp. 417]
KELFKSGDHNFSSSTLRWWLICLAAEIGSYFTAVEPFRCAPIKDDAERQFDARYHVNWYTIEESFR